MDEKIVQSEFVVAGERYPSPVYGRKAGLRPPSPGGRGLYVCFLAVLAIVALVSGCSQKKEAAAAPPEPAPTVKVADVVEKSVPIYGNWITTLHGYVNAQIQPQVTGYLIKQDYKEGSFVQKGDVLFEIDPRPFQAALDHAKAQLAAAKAQLGNAALNVKRDIPEAKAHAIPQSQLDTDTQAKLAAEASVQAAQAAVEQAQLNVGYTKVRSLISGIAGVTEVQVGNLVSPTTVLTSVSQVNPIKAYFPISSIEYLRMAGGGHSGTVDLLSRAHRIPLQLALPDGENYPYKGTILFADRQVDPQTGTIQIIGEFPNPRKVLRPGQTGQIHAVTERLSDALLVPQRAVTELQGGYEVAVVGPDNKVAIHSVDVGPQVGSLWVINKGIKAGEQVVAEGTAKVRDGMKVNPQPYTP